MNIKISKDGVSLNITSFSFPGGEIGVKLDANNAKYLYARAPYQAITARLQSPKDVMELVLATDALRRFDKTPINLIMPYVPYGRQDRVCVEGESFSLKAFANLINSLKFNEVITYDPHSDVTSAVIDNIHVINQIQIVGRFDAFTKEIISRHWRFISPDAGANKKTSNMAAYFGHEKFIRADKLRDLSTGDIKETVVYDDVSGMSIMILDDICDGGRTFIELAKVLYAKGALEVGLYVTHGIFSKGTKPLYDAGITNIFTTNAYYDVWPNGISDKVTTLNLESVFP